MNRIAIIPARGGSKRLPRKNILPVNGYPMLNYPVKMALESKLFDAVLVSTEDEEIAKIAQQAGAEVVIRPENLARDKSTVAQVCLHVLEKYPVTEFCCIYATAILLRSETLHQAYQELYRITGTNYVMGVSEYNYPPVQALKSDKDGFLTYMWPDYIGKQSQSYPRLLVSNGTFVWARRDSFMQDRIFYAKGLRGFLVPTNESLDIDTQEDYESLLQRMNNDAF